jgi:hypothetical protein
MQVKSTRVQLALDSHDSGDDNRIDCSFQPNAVPVIRSPRVPSQTAKAYRDHQAALILRGSRSMFRSVKRLHLECDGRPLAHGDSRPDHEAAWGYPRLFANARTSQCVGLPAQ